MNQTFENEDLKEHAGFKKCPVLYCNASGFLLGSAGLGAALSYLGLSCFL